MKTTCSLLASLVLCLVAGTASAETVHQTVKGDAAFSGQGGSAVDKKQMEVKDLPEGKVAHVIGSFPQWGYVNYWFGIPSPAGESIIRVKVYVDENETAPYAFYIKREGAEPLMNKLEIPADAPKNAVTTIDIPVDIAQEWNGLTFKKIGSSDQPSPWIESISLVRP